MDVSQRSCHRWFGLSLAVLGLCVMVLSGCTTRRQGVDMSGFTDAVARINAAGIAGNSQPVARTVAYAPPQTVVIARVSARAGGTNDQRDDYGRVTRATERERLDGGHVSPDRPWVVEEGVNERQETLASGRARNARIVRFSQLVDLPVRLTPEQIMDSARARGADWLCVYSAQTEYDRSGGVSLIQVFTLGLAPAATDAKSEIDMCIVDLRNNAVIDKWRAKETGWQPAIGWTYKEASQQSADRAETRALRAVMDRLDKQVLGPNPGRTHCSD